MPRKAPYTRRGIRRVPCKRCGKPSQSQWQICANHNNYLGVCKQCDIELNDLILEFFHFKNKKELMERYIRRNT